MTIAFNHFVTLPPDIEKELYQQDIFTMKGSLRMPGLVRKYLDDPTYSFAVVVFSIATRSLDGMSGFPTSRQPLDSIVSKNRDSWNEAERKKVLSPYYAVTLQGYYDQEVFSSYAIPVVYEKTIHNSDDLVKELRRLLHLCINDEKPKVQSNRDNFIKWSRKNSPTKNPYLSALMMGLFTVDSYAFNDETGVYTMNERGKMLMDFIVEFPIPENATRLQAVMNGGNKDAIQTMMKKHGTEEKWHELLKNPVHPEFAKYPQDE